MTVFTLSILLTLLAGAQINEHQRKFNDVLNYQYHIGGNWGLMEMRKILKGEDGAFIDASVQNNTALSMACSAGDTELVKLLISHPSVDPRVPRNEPMFLANQKLHTAVVEVLLRDGRAHIDVIYQVSWPEQMINPSYMNRIRKIPQIALEVCISGNVDLAQSLNLDYMEEHHLNLLYERARNRPVIQKIIRSWQLKLLGAPKSQQRNAALLKFLAPFGNVSLEQLKRLARSHALWMNVSNIPVEIIAEIVPCELSESPSIIVTENVLSSARRYVQTTSYNNPTLYFSCLFMLNHFIDGLEGIEGFKTVMRLTFFWALVHEYYGIYTFNNPVPEDDSEAFNFIMRKLASKFVIVVAIVKMVPF